MMQNCSSLVLRLSVLPKCSLSLLSLLLAFFLLFVSCSLLASDALTVSDKTLGGDNVGPGIVGDNNNYSASDHARKSAIAAIAQGKKTNVVSEQASSAEQQKPGNSSYANTGFLGIQSLSKVIVSLLIVIGCIFLISKLAQRFLVPAVPDKDGIEILSAIQLGGKERLLLVKVGQKKVLISSGAQGTHLISEIDSSKDACASITQEKGVGVEFHMAKQAFQGKKQLG